MPRQTSPVRLLSGELDGDDDRPFMAGHCRSRRCAGAANGRALEKSQMQLFIFRWTATVARGDSAHHAVHDGRRPFGLLQYVGHVQAGMTLLTRRPLPSNRRRMPSCL